MDTTTIAQERVRNTLVARTFIWLTAGLVISGAVAAYVGSNDTLYRQFVDNRVLFWIVLLAPIGIIILLGWGIDRLSVTSATLLYILFSFAEGLMLSFVFQAYTTSSVAQVFFIAAAMFGIAGAIGFFTERDLSSLGGIMLVALIGLVLGTIVNLIWANETLYWIITYAGIAIFLGLTVYDFNIVKRQSAVDMSPEVQAKSSLWLAIALYLDFVNLFLLLLRVFGRSR